MFMRTFHLLERCKQQAFGSSSRLFRNAIIDDMVAFGEVGSSDNTFPSLEGLAGFK
jgi:hypothetical protein